MATLRISGDTSGYIDLRAPTTGAANVFTFPATTGTILTDATTSGINASAISVGTLGKSRLPTGSVLQVVQGTTTSTATSTNNSTFVDSNLTASITPTSASSKILVIGQHGSARMNGSSNGLAVRLMRDSTSISVISTEFLYLTNAIDIILPFQYLDSPATTSSITYKTQFKLLTGSTTTAQLNPNDTPAYITLLEIAG
jgi:hypothetical protein